MAESNNPVQPRAQQGGQVTIGFGVQFAQVPAFQISVLNQLDPLCKIRSGVDSIQKNTMNGQLLCFEIEQLLKQIIVKWKGRVEEPVARALVAQLCEAGASYSIGNTSFGSILPLCEALKSLNDKFEVEVGRLDGEFEKLRKVINQYREEVRQSDVEKRKENDLLKKEVSSLRDEVTNLQDELRVQKDRAAVSDIDSAQAILREVLNQVTTLMYKIIFPSLASVKKNGKKFTFTDLEDKVNNIRDKDDKIVKTAQLEELISDIGWRPDMEAEIIKLKNAYHFNTGAHPPLDSKTDVKSNIELLVQKEFLAEEDLLLCTDLAEKWEKLMNIHNSVPQP